MTKKEMMLLDTLESQFMNLDRMPLDAIPRLQAIIHQAPNEALEAIVRRRIRFCDTVANSELVKRGVYPAEAKIDHLTNVLMRNRGGGEPCPLKS